MHSQPNQKPRITHGEAYATLPEYRARFDRMRDAVRPIHDLVAELMANGLCGEQAWFEALKQVRP